MRHYRNANTGIPGEYPPALAAHFPELIEVDPDAKPLAFTPIPQIVIDDLRAQNADEADEPDEKEED